MGKDLRIHEWEGTITFMNAVVRYPVELGAALRRARQLRHLTQQQLADAIGASRRWVGMLEAGHNHGAQFLMVLRAADALGLNICLRDKDIT